jgi:putative tributyrin esterase
MSSAFRTIKLTDPRFERDGLRHVTVKSAALGQRADLSLFLPVEGRGASELPVVILLHGVYGSHWSWALNAGAHLTAARMIAAGEIPPLVLAMPSDGLWGDGSAYLPHVEQDFEKWIVEEAPLAATEASDLVSAESPLFIAGLSMGGFGALRLGAKFGARFGGISAHSSITMLEHLEGFVEESIDCYRAVEKEPNVLSAILQYRNALPPLRFDCGEQDSLLMANRDLHRALEEAEITHSYQEFPGGHEWPYWEAHLEESLRFFGAQL